MTFSKSCKHWFHIKICGNLIIYKYLIGRIFFSISRKAIKILKVRMKAEFLFSFNMNKFPKRKKDHHLAWRSSIAQVGHPKKTFSSGLSEELACQNFQSRYLNANFVLRDQKQIFVVQKGQTFNKIYIKNLPGCNKLMQIHQI